MNCSMGLSWQRFILRSNKTITKGLWDSGNWVSILSLQWIFNCLLFPKGQCVKLWALSLICGYFFNTHLEKHRCLTHFVQLNGPLQSEIDIGRCMLCLYHLGNGCISPSAGREGGECWQQRQQGDSEPGILSWWYTQAARFITSCYNASASTLSVKSSITSMTSCWGFCHWESLKLVINKPSLIIYRQQLRHGSHWCAGLAQKLSRRLAFFFHGAFSLKKGNTVPNHFISLFISHYPLTNSSLKDTTKSRQTQKVTLWQKQCLGVEDNYKKDSPTLEGCRYLSQN